jgi:hypothetical protein
LPALPEAGTAAAVAIGGAFDPDAVRALVESKRPELNACFLLARSSDPSLWGRLALAAILEVDGTVHRISEVESHFPNAAAARCAQRLLAGVVFPSVNGKPFTLVIPIRLGPPSQASQSDAGPELDSSPPEAPDDAASD